MDRKYLLRCLQLARNGMQNAKPNPMVGAVIVARGRIIGEGYHVRCGEGHAEVNAFASVKPEDEALLPEATIYVSLEPCSHYGKTPPCADLIIRKGVKRAVVGCVDPFAKVHGNGIRKLREAGIEVEVGVLEDECKELNKRFFTFHTHHRPYILLKWCRTANGFLDDNYKPVMLSTPFTQMLSHIDRNNPCFEGLDFSGGVAQQIADKLYEAGKQSLIVEGGAVTLQSFIDAGLWDEIRIETSPATVSGGTEAPLLPHDVRLVSRKTYGENVIEYFERNRQ